MFGGETIRSTCTQINVNIQEDGTSDDVSNCRAERRCGVEETGVGEKRVFCCIVTKKSWREDVEYGAGETAENHSEDEYDVGARLTCAR